MLIYNISIMSVKEKLKTYLREKGVTQAEFAESIGVSTGYVNAIRKSIQPDKLAIIKSKYPDLDISWLLAGEESLNELHTNTSFTLETSINKSKDFNFIELSIEDKLNSLYDTILLNSKVLNDRIEELEEKLRLSQLINRTYLRSLITSGKIKSEDLDSAKYLEINIDQKKQSSN